MLKEIPSWLRTPPPSYTRPAPPRVSAGPVWDTMVAQVKADGHPEPERLADSMLRLRENALAIKNARSHILVTEYQAESKAHKVSKPSGPKCKATTLANKPCPYKATFCGYCSKHQPSEFTLGK